MKIWRRWRRKRREFGIEPVIHPRRKWKKNNVLDWLDVKTEWVAFDSFGVKSDCFTIETKDCKICVDPGVARETGSFPFSREERSRLRDHYETKIRKACSESNVVILTHYHYDHHIPDPEMYEGKTLLIKDPENNINKSQRKRAMGLLEDLKADIHVADGESFEFGATKISFSKPVWHGVQDTKLGYVLMAKFQKNGESLLYTSDVDGPLLKETTDWIVNENPNILIVDGPPTYLLGFIMAYYNLARSILNLCEIIDRTNPKFILLDHHLVRDYRYPDLLYEVYRKAEKLDRKVCTAAELIGGKTKVLEGYEMNGATKWKRWERFTKKDMINVLENAVENNLVEKNWLERAKRF